MNSAHQKLISPYQKQPFLIRRFSRFNSDGRQMLKDPLLMRVLLSSRRWGAWVDGNRCRSRCCRCWCIRSRCGSVSRSRLSVPTGIRTGCRRCDRLWSVPRLRSHRSSRLRSVRRSGSLRRSLVHRSSRSNRLRRTSVDRL
jgi:hypothetical protein